MEIIALFPTPVGRFKLDRDLTEREVSFVKNLDRVQNLTNYRSVGSYIFQSEELKDIYKFCQESVNTFLKEIYVPSTEFNLRITQSWANYASANQSHHPHEHPNSFISGVFYVEANRIKDKIHFNRTGYQQILAEPAQFNPFNSRAWWLEIQAGELLLFPSSLNHYVASVIGEERISIAFNTFPVGTIGSESGLTELKL